MKPIMFLHWPTWTDIPVPLPKAALDALAQILALAPGVSRSGITITAGLLSGLKREDAARFSFLLATPIIHQPELALNDSLIVATALVLDRIVITRNRRDFHYEAGLTWIDAEGFRPDQGPLLDSRAAVEAGPGPRHCCSRIR